MEDIIRKSMLNQPIINIGVIGHVADGKSTIVRDLTGTATQKYKNEMKDGITIKLGYANAKIFKCPSCESPESYQSCKSDVVEYDCKQCGSKCELVNHISFVDAPGHNKLMATMLNGTCVMNYTMLVESAENSLGGNKIGIPAPQTKEHMMITQLAGIQTKIVCLNKLDLVKKQNAKLLMEKMRNYLNEHNTDAPLIPTSATLGINIDVLCEYLSNLQIPEKDLLSPFKMMIIRSFNINHSNIKICDIRGGVIGGSLVRGILRPNMNVVIYPGYIYKKSNKWEYKPIKAKTISISSDKTLLDYAISGGLIGVQLDIDPALSGDDKLVGQIMIPDNDEALRKIHVFDNVSVKYKDVNEIINYNENDVFMININANNLNGTVINTGNNTIELKFDKPICAEIGDKITISRKGDEMTMKILSYGEIIDGHHI